MRKVIFWLIVALSTACAGEENEPACIDASNIGDPQACPAVVMPVCGCNAKTYSNECVAKASGVLTWTEGACTTDGMRPIE